MSMTHPTRIYFRLLSYLKPYKIDFLLGILGTAAASGIAAAFAWFLKPLMNSGFVHPNVTFIRWAPFVVIAAYFLMGVVCFIGDFFAARTARQVVRDLQRSVLDKFLVLPFSYLNQRSSGSLLSLLIYNVDQVAEAVSSAMLTIVKDGFYLAGLLAVMILNSWQLSLIFLIFMPVVGIIVKQMSTRLKKLSLNVQASVGAMSRVAKETLDGERIVRSFAGASYEKNKMIQATQQLFHRQMKIAVTSSIGSSLARIVPALAIAIILYAATSPHYSLSAGAFISTIAAMFAAFKPFKNLMDINSVLQRGMAGAASVFGVLDAEDEVDKGFREINRAMGKIEFREVDFTYPGRDKPAISGVSFTIRPGERVALIGPSGSGKTTAVNLLSRFYEMDSGKILLDDMDIREIKLSNLRSQIAMVSDRVSFFNDTIARNIAYGFVEPIEEAKITKAAEAACLMPWIQALPLKMNTIVGDNGILVSAGERQRMAIARAILRNAPILILDEATSGVDNETEKMIQTAILNLSRDKTTILISHRLNPHFPVDQVITFQESGIRGQGSGVRDQESGVRGGMIN